MKQLHLKQQRNSKRQSKQAIEKEKELMDQQLSRQQYQNYYKKNFLNDIQKSQNNQSYIVFNQSASTDNLGIEWDQDRSRCPNNKLLN